MRIETIRVERFRSIHHQQVEVGGFNVFVGQNNHGKTNLFEAIEWFYTGKGEIDKIRYGREGTDEVAVEIEFSAVQEGFDKMRNLKNRSSLENLIGDQDRVRIRRSSVEARKRKIWSDKEGGWLDRNPTGFDAALNDFLPKLEYVSTAISPADYVKYGRNTPIANMLSGVLTEILEQSEPYRAFREKFDELFSSERSEVRIRLDELSGKVQVQLAKQFPDCTRVVFEVAPPEFDELLKSFETSVDDGVYTDAREKGDGMQRALMLAILQTYCEFRRGRPDDASKDFIFLIDEAELHLHPSAQRKLKNALISIAEAGDQVLINTHSSVLVVDDHPGQALFKVEKIERETRISVVPPAGKSSVVYELLGGSPADLLLPRNIFIIEGLSDAELLTRVISRFYPEQPQLQLIPAHGDIAQARRSFAYLTSAYRALSTSIFADRLVIFADRQNDRGQVEAFEAAYPDLRRRGQLRESPHGSLEEAYPARWRRNPQGMTGEAKVVLARFVGEQVTSDEFENEMPELHAALQTAWGSAFD